jgi:uncharacterized protein
VSCLQRRANFLELLHTTQSTIDLGASPNAPIKQLDSIHRDPVPLPMTLVLDTNIALDLLVFRDAGVQGLERAIEQRHVTIVANALVIDELRRVLAYPQCKLMLDEQQDLLDRYRALSSELALPEGFTRDNLLLPGGFPLCRDGDDQHFLALTYHARADGLVTKDKQVLKLRKRAARFGVNILDPDALRTRLSA